ncbi:MAG TPA: RluA family pseudouridine synthase [Salinivirgaceae bacterium]|nr:RluA family pseudouridine synthase [Salinivirgaceae bacterium]
MEILYEDNHLIAVNKPAGLPVQGDESGDTTLIELVSAYIKETYAKPGNVFVGLVHRVDRPVSGIVLFAKTSKALARMNTMFQNREVEKIYLAIVGEQPKELSGKLEHYILRDTKTNKSHAHQKPKKDAKLGVLSYELVGRTDNYFLLKINLETGRHHQIRCQLAKIGCPIRGDLKYGFPRSIPGGGINLHSYKLTFTHPVQKIPIEIVAPLPQNDILWKEFAQVVYSI